MSLDRPEGQDTPAAQSTPATPVGPVQPKSSKLSERIKDTAQVEEDIAELFAGNWQRLAGALFVLLLIIWLVSEFRSRQALEQAAAAERFSQARAEFAKIIAPEDGKTDGEDNKAQAADEIRAMEDKFKALSSGHSGSVYAKLADLYLASAYISRGNYGAARGILAKYPADRIVSGAAGASAKKAEKIAGEQFLVELAALVRARLDLAEGKSPLEDIAQYVATVVERSTWANVEALLLLYRISANNPELRAQAAAAAAKLVKLRPEMAEAIRIELEEMGISPPQ